MGGHFWGPDPPWAPLGTHKAPREDKKSSKWHPETPLGTPNKAPGATTRAQESAKGEPKELQRRHESPK